MIRLAALAAALTLAACAPPQPPPPAATAEPLAIAGDIRVLDAWAHETPSGARVAGVYVVIANAGDAPDRLIAAESSRAARVDLHEMRMDGDLAVMRAVRGLDVPAHAIALMAPGGMHVMLNEIDAPLAAGQAVPLTLRFARAGSLTLEAPVRVRARDATDGGHAGHAH